MGRKRNGVVDGEEKINIFSFTLLAAAAAATAAPESNSACGASEHKHGY